MWKRKNGGTKNECVLAIFKCMCDEWAYKKWINEKKHVVPLSMCHRGGSYVERMNVATKYLGLMKWK